MYLFDTDHIGIRQRRTQPEYARLSLRVGKHSPRAFFYSAVSLHEQMLGAHGFINRAKDHAGVVRGYVFFEVLLADYCQMQVLPFDAAAAADLARCGLEKCALGRWTSVSRQSP